jgi:hypothetical protein
MLNVHRRTFAATPEAIGRWLERAWSATDEDIFPRDVIPTRRRNPPGVAPGALIPGRTRLGHGPFSFKLERWDGTVWRVGFANPGARGWHGFELRPCAGGTEVTHTVDARTSPLFWLGWRIAIEPLHDWAVEALFDRLAAALRDGRVPTRTTRPMTGRGRWLLRLVRGR